MSDDEYEIPLQDQRVFGAGLKRKRVLFVPSSTSLSTTTTPPQPTTGSTSVSDRYLALVLSEPTPVITNPAPPNTSSSSSSAPAPPNQDLLPSPETTSPTPSTLTSRPPPPPPLCSICALPLSSTPKTTTNSSSSTTTPPAPHEASLPHQLCLPHSHPPSHLDRTRLGLRYLRSHGWDPDSRLGLGVPGKEGIRFPVKARVKDDKMGLGMVVPGDWGGGGRGGEVTNKKSEVKGRLDAGKVRKLEERERREGERLRELFYRSEDLERYLGSGGGGGGA